MAMTKNQILKRHLIGGIRSIVVMVFVLSILVTGCDVPIPSGQFEELTLISETQHSSPPYMIYKNAGEIRVELDNEVILRQTTQDAVKYAVFGPGNRYLLVMDTYNQAGNERFDIYLANLTVDGLNDDIRLLNEVEDQSSDPEMKFQRSRGDSDLLFSHMRVRHPGQPQHLRVAYSADRSWLCGDGGGAGINPNQEIKGVIVAETTADAVVLSDTIGPWEFECPLPQNNAPDIVLSTRNIEFGEVEPGQSESRDLTVYNRGGTPLSFDVGVESDDALFSVTPDHGSVSANNETTVRVTFAPSPDTTPGRKNGTLTFNHNIPQVAPVTVSVSGQVVATAAEIRVVPQRLDFDPVLPGQTSDIERLSVHNDGGSPLSFTFASDSPLFHAVRTDNVDNVPPGAVAVINVTFEPPCGLVSGSQSAVLTVTGSEEAIPVPLTATVPQQRPQIEVTVPSLDFGTVRRGHTNSEVIPIKNNGNGDLGYGRITITDPLFTLAHSQGTVPPGETRYVGVTVAPDMDTPLGPVTATVTVPHDDCTRPPQEIPVTATIANEPTPAPSITGLPSHLTFVNVWPGEIVTRDFSIRNAGNLPLTFAIASNHPMFTVAPGSGELEPGAHVAITLTFTPPEGIAPGSQLGELTITHNDPNKGPHTVILEGVVWSSDWRIHYEAPSQDPAESLTDVHFFDGDHGLAVGGYPGLIVRTTNRGETWSRLSNPAWADIRDVDFAEPMRGWAVSGGLVLATDDAGVTWMQQYSLPGAAFNGVAFGNAQTGWVIGNSGTIIHTINGGEMWTPQTCGVTAHLLDITAFDETHAWVVGAGGVVCRTSDGGGQWIETHPYWNANHLFGVDFANTMHGLAVGDRGLILRTENGGVTWDAIPPEDIFVYSGMPTMRLNAVFLREPWGQAWAVGADGTILFSYNGGRTWTQQPTGIDHDLTGLSYDGDQGLWASGFPGVLLRRHVFPR